MAYLGNSKISSSLKPSDSFVPRHLGNNPKHIDEMLEVIGVKSIEELMDQTVPQNIRLKPEDAFKHNGKEVVGIESETMTMAHLRDLAKTNKVFKSY